MAVLMLPPQKLRLWLRRVKRRVRPRRTNLVVKPNRLDPAGLPLNLRREVRAILTDRVPYMLVHTPAVNVPEARNLIEALRRLRHGCRCRLAVIGPAAQAWAALLKTAGRTARELPRLVTPLRDLTSEEAQSLARNTVALLLPSGESGEALRAGVPCGAHLLVANTPENRARYRDTVTYYDPLDARSLAFAIRRVMDALSYNDIGATPMQADTPAKPASTSAAPAPVAKPPPPAVYDARLPLYFLHIPKAAGTSVRLLVEDQYPYEQVCTSYYPEQLRAISPERLTAFRFYRGHFSTALTPLLPTPVNTFTWLREPLDWLLSDFAFRKQEHVVPESMTLPEWLEIIGSDPVCHFLAMPPALSAEDGSLSVVEKAKSVLQNCFLTGLVERHEDSINLLCYHLGIYPPESGAAMNRSRSRTQWDEYPTEIRKQAERLFAGDLALYAWAKPRFEAQMQAMLAALRPELTARFGAAEAPTTEQVRALLRERFFQRQEATPLREEIDYTFDQPLIGEGWYERQTSGPVSPFGCARGIAGDSCRATLYLPIRRERPCLLRFGLSEIYTPKAVAGLRLEVNGVPVSLQRDSHGHPHLLSEMVFRAEIPVAALERARHLTQLTFATDAFMRPVDTDPFLRDTSKLTVALNWITIRKAEG